MKQFVQNLARAFATFGAVAGISLVAHSILLEKTFLSDDSYIVGFFIGIVVAVALVVALIVKQFFGELAGRWVYVACMFCRYWL
jgi:hypothetical protein